MDDEKKEKKNTLKTFVIILLTVIFTLIIMIGLLAFYVYKANPFNIQACIITSILPPIVENEAGLEEVGGTATAGVLPKTSTEKVDHPLLSDEQEKSLQSAGVDIGSLPSSITPEMEKCFIEKLGSKRVEEVKSGSTLGPLDILKGSSCL